ncbi:hypothetical protein [Bacteroides sp. 224]|uniref:hypothetical protein n=1 Tax=Bacteroides sp. 224 TaxID=2302936 RepID=UPI0013D3D5CD|nr:hypothetical protein [Bacteroides sp. 224]NDV66683.1 hypothetical protein [Bacteroides sp. 224]
MIEYWQSYEIDGSDSSYNVVVAEREKCIELLKFYLQLKVAHRGKPIKIHRSSGKDSQIVKDMYFAYEHLDDLWDVIRHCNLKYLQLEYEYVASGSLYPEVKRELIDMLAHHAGVKNHTFVNPVFSNSYTTTSYINISFDAKPSNDYEMVCSENYFQIISKEHPLLVIDFDCVLNGPHELMFYGMHKMKDAFPEFEIDMHTSHELLAAYSINWDELIMEGISLESSDYAYTLKWLLSNPAITMHPDNDTIYLGRLPMGFEHFDPLVVYIDEKGSNYWTKDEINDYLALQGIFGKRTFSIDEYLQKVYKASKAEIFSDADFESYTSFNIEVAVGKDKQQHAVVKFVREKDGPKLMILIAYKYREGLERMIRLGC